MRKATVVSIIDSCFTYAVKRSGLKFKYDLYNQYYDLRNFIVESSTQVLSLSEIPIGSIVIIENIDEVLVTEHTIDIFGIVTEKNSYVPECHFMIKEDVDRYSDLTFDYDTRECNIRQRLGSEFNQLEKQKIKYYNGV